MAFKKIINDPYKVVDEMVEGIVLAHYDILKFANNNKRAVVRKDAPIKDKVGILIGGGFILYALSFLLTDVVRALIMFYMTPVWTTIFEIIFLKKKHGWQRILSLSLALGGLWVVFGQGGKIPLPENVGRDPI